jgi:dipeptidase
MLRNKRFFRTAAAAVMAVAVVLPSMSAAACTTVLVGKDASADGSTIIARNEDSSTKNPKYFVVHPAQKNAKGTMYVSTNTDLEEKDRFTIELPEEQFKYTATPEWTAEYGQYEESGTNEKGVAMSATESTSYNKKTEKADPLVKNGIAEESMLTVVLPYISTAKEGVQRLGEIVEKYGAAETNGVAFSDQNDVWYMEIVSGHHWVAMRIPDDRYAVVANQMAIRNVDFNNTEKFMWSTGIQDFVKKNKLNSSKKNFNVRNIFSTNDKDDASYNICRVWDGQRILTPSQKGKYSITSKKIPMIQKADKKITVDMVKQVLSSHYNGTKYDSYGKNVGNYRPINVQRTMEAHIIQWRQDMPVEISGIQWLAFGAPEHSVFVPFYNGITETPDSYKKGGETYSADSAYWTYKLVDVLTTPYYNDLMPKYTAPALKKIQDQMYANVKASDEKAMSMKDKKAELTKYLTEEGMKNAEYSLAQVNELNALLTTLSTDARRQFHNPNL